MVTYTTDELTAAAQKVFGYGKALVAAALHMSGKTEFTLDEAKAIVEEFAQSEVD